jgi:acyl-CoA synthetase
MRHPLVDRAAAYPVSDDRLGEKVCLSVACHAGQTIAPMEMLAHLDQCGLSKFDMPEYFLMLDKFPLTASGKILKRELVEMTSRGELAPIPVNFKDLISTGE